MNSSMPIFTNSTTSDIASNTAGSTGGIFLGISWESWLAIAGALCTILTAFWQQQNIVFFVENVRDWAAKKKLAVKRWWRSIRGKTPDQEEAEEAKDIEDEAGAPIELSISMANSHTTQVVNNYYSFHHGHPAVSLQLPAAAVVRPTSRTISNSAEAPFRTRVRAATLSGVRDGNASPPDRCTV
ncbi:uncharacterized protein LAJ45_09468 [Morchella importuna]|uniref:uncharacterized protein n=1 Tax=Morchella importuna TaxID=1174673 RepID=UPI001E8ECA1C|nr:uncharacterized protein LAJ45_09468 [Morchella importuna]KAH8146522.1 hypothetical protein LAJ45_09468 [Morchella importuna]